MAEVRRGREAPSFRPPRTMVTNAASSVPLLKGAQVLERIRKDSLIANAAVVGRYMLSHLQKDNPEARGVGLLLYGNQTLRVDGAMGRLMPHLDITKRDVDALLAEAKRSRRR